MFSRARCPIPLFYCAADHCGSPFFASGAGFWWVRASATGCLLCARSRAWPGRARTVLQHDAEHLAQPDQDSSLRTPFNMPHPHAALALIIGTDHPMCTGRQGLRCRAILTKSSPSCSPHARVRTRPCGPCHSCSILLRGCLAAALPLSCAPARLLLPLAEKPGSTVNLTADEVTWLIDEATTICVNQPALLELEAPIQIVGDIHGQFHDLLRLFEHCGFPPDANYLFLGDYVDRGKNGLECICMLLAYKIKYPENFFLLRGNHECASINRIYGFYDECKRRYNIKMWKKFQDVFNVLPFAALIDEKIFCIHAGLSPDLNSPEQIKRIMRPTDVPDSGLLCDLLWSDPEADISGWAENDRGVSYTFGADVVSKFLQKHDYDLIVRAHQVVEDGYEFFADRQLVTIFSAPNYCGEFDNAGAVMAVDESLMCSFRILKPADKSTIGNTSNRPLTPPRKK